MKQQYAFLPVIAVMALGACTQRLDDQDRALLMETRTMAEQASADAKAARLDADRAAASSEKSDRIFRQGQIK